MWLQAALIATAAAIEPGSSWLLRIAVQLSSQLVPEGEAKCSLARLFWIGDPAVPENREILENHLIVPLTLFVKISDSERLSQIERNLLISSIQFLNMIS